MGMGFDTPLGGLALEMAYRNMEAKKKAGEQNAYEQALVNKRVEMYGGNPADYQNVWDRGYGGAMQAAQSNAQALQDYWVGLPEVLVAAAKESQSAGSGGGSASSTPMPTGPTVTGEDLLRRAGIIPPPNLQGTLIRPSYTNPDTAEARSRVAARPRYVAPVRARRVVTPQMGR